VHLLNYAIHKLKLNFSYYIFLNKYSNMSWFGYNSESEKLRSLEEFKANAQTLDSRIEEIRHDHKNSLTTIGEDSDNSMCWANCDNIIVDIFENTFNFADDGLGFPSLERFNQSLLLGSKNTVLKDNSSTETIFKGKFGLGLPKGSIIVGNKVSVISKVDGCDDIYIAIANWEKMKLMNSYTPNIRKANEEEIEEYNSYYGKGTLIKYENLLNECILDPYNVYNYLICLYKKTPNDTKMPRIHIYNNHQLFNFNDDVMKFQNPIVDFLDTSFQEKDRDNLKYGYLIRQNNGKFELCMENDLTPFNYRTLKSGNYSNEYENIEYIIKIVINAIGTQYIKNSGFINKNNNDLIGFKIYRNGRDVTTSKALKFSSIDPSKTMYRDKGVRINLEFCSNISNTNIFDNDFKVSSLKSIDETCYYHFNESLRECLNKIGEIAENNFENRKKIEKMHAEVHLNKMFNYIQTDSKVMIKDLVITYMRIIETLYISGKYSPDIDNKDIVPFEFDKRNGFYKSFYNEKYYNLKKLLVTRLKVLENPELYASESEHSESEHSDSQHIDSQESDEDSDSQHIDSQESNENSDSQHIDSQESDSQHIDSQESNDEDSESGDSRHSDKDNEFSKLKEIVAFFNDQSIETIKQKISELEEDAVEIIYQKLFEE
jgi:hypothetical protein